MQRDDESIDFEEADDEAAEAAPPVSQSDKKIEKDYEAGRLRVVQDRNDFFLPHVLDFITGRQWGNLNPEYQRRLRWSNEKKSRLIESFLMNVPVPPVFLYDSSSTKLEVLDGQQRISAIVDFLTNKFALEKLTIWPTLNARTFATLPPALKRGLNRSKLSAITLITERSKSVDAIDLRAQVFDRLNTGGEKLNPQELRNCLYSGPFNRLIVELAARDDFSKAWGIPLRKDHTLSDGSYDDVLRKNVMFRSMADCQIVLRYFAFKDPEYIVGSTRNILDNCMIRLRRADDEQIKALRTAFVDALTTALAIFGPRAFRVAGKTNNKGRLSRPLFDAEMVAITRLIDKRELLIEKKANIVSKIRELTREGTKSYETIVGRPNTAAAIKARIDVVEKAMRAAIK